MNAAFKDLVRGIAHVYQSPLFVLSLIIFSVRPLSFLQPESHLRWPSLGPSDSTRPWVSPEHEPTSLRHTEAGLSKCETPLSWWVPSVKILHMASWLLGLSHHLLTEQEEVRMKSRYLRMVWNLLG